MPLPVHIDRQNPGSFRRQIEDQLRTLLVRGYLQAGDRLPSTRALATDLCVARRTVATVYEEMIAEGLFESRPSSGTFVPHAVQQILPGANVEETRNEAPLRPLSTIRAAMPTAPSLFVAPGRHFAFDLRLGRPDASAFPIRSWRRLLIEHLETAGRSTSDYTDPAGNFTLREALARDVLPGRGIVCHADDIVIVGGTQEGLNLVGRLFRVSGQSVAIENPCYEGAALAFLSLGAKLDPCEVDQEGVRTETLAKSKARLIYVTPSHQFPLGMTMSADRREALVDWANTSGSIIIEDDYDSDVQYDHSSAALKAMAPDHVIYIGSFSKAIGPGLRLGYLVMPPRFARAARAMKAVMSHGQPWLEQAVLGDFIASGLFDKHRRSMKAHYKRRRDVLLAGLTRIAPGSTFQGLGSGMHLVWSLPPDLPDVEPLRQKCAALDVGIYSLATSPCFMLQRIRHQGQLAFCGYAALTPAELDQAVSRIERAMLRASSH